MRLTDLLGVELPIIQAPMAGVQDAALAVAVCNAGGVGSLPAAMLDPATLRHELDAIVKGTTRPFNVNFFCHAPPDDDPTREGAWREALSPYYAEFDLDPGSVRAGTPRIPFGVPAAEIVEAIRTPIVSFHFGLPAPELLERVRATGAKILASATTVAEARWLEARGVDAVIAQGAEAGGHRGLFLSSDPSTQLGLFALLPQIVAAVQVPVIAAGGIADAAGVAAAFALGAAGVQPGTTYLLCPEATTTSVHRALLKSGAASHTVLTNVFTGRLARGIVNRLVRELGPISSIAPAFPLAATALGPLRARAEARGSGEFSPLWCGQNPKGCREIPAAELTRELAAGVPHFT